ncbi:ABC transporter transmembrane domain-containing protein [Brachybacterium sp. GCM10030267]|uniref:ABC transporter transmembrane domain-containing protein n=1 Tax=Brachybacterium sp. GCM10030267 TaxID=3273381 RepID=UPI00360732E4
MRTVPTPDHSAEDQMQGFAADDATGDRGPAENGGTAENVEPAANVESAENNSGEPARRTPSLPWSEEEQADVWSGSASDGVGQDDAVEHGDAEDGDVQVGDSQVGDAQDGAQAAHERVASPGVHPVAAPIARRGVRVRRPPRASHNPQPFRHLVSGAGVSAPADDGPVTGGDLTHGAGERAEEVPAGADETGFASASPGEDAWVQGPVEGIDEPQSEVLGAAEDVDDPTEHDPAEPIEDDLAEDAPIEHDPAEPEPIEDDLAEDAPIEHDPAEPEPIEDELAEDAPIEHDPAEAFDIDPGTGRRWTVVDESAGSEPSAGAADQGSTPTSAPPRARPAGGDARGKAYPVPGTLGSPGDEPATTPTAEPTAKASEKKGPSPLQRTLDLLSPHLRAHRPGYITGSIALLLSVWLLVALPFPLKYAVDAAIATTGAEIPAIRVGGDPAGALATSVIVLAALLTLQVLTRFVGIAALGRVGTRMATDLRSRLLSHLHRLTPEAGTSGERKSGAAPAATASSSGSEADGESAVALIEDVARLRDLFSQSGPRVAAGVLTLASLLIVTVIIEPLAALVLLVTGLLYAVPAVFVLRRAGAADRRAATEERMLADTAEELVSATGTIQSYGLETRSERGLTEAGNRAGRAVTAARRSQSLLQLLAQIVAGVGVLGTLLLAGARVAAGSMSPGDLVLVLAYVAITILVLRELLPHTGVLRDATSAGENLSALLERRAGIAEPQRTQPVGRVRGEIVFSALDAKDGEGGHLFDTVSLVVPAGQHVALLDEAGHESSALISYLQRFDQPDTGRVLLDRFDTRTVALADLRRQIAVVQREPVLFTDTVRENIRIGRPDATDADVLEAARKAGVDEFVAQLPDGLDTVLFRRGDVLTDGQRRRVAIARALVRDAPVVVLDAADADLSGPERRPVLRALATLIEGRTAIVRSRDPETIAEMDRVLWLEAGDIREDGEPSALAADPGTRLATWLSRQDDSVR